MSEPEGLTNPRRLSLCIQRVSFWGSKRCSVRLVRHNRMVSTGEEWDSREPCGELALYALVRSGRVSPRCEEHAREDAKRLDIIINERQKIELPARLFKKRRVSEGG